MSLQLYHVVVGAAFTALSLAWYAAGAENAGELLYRLAVAVITMFFGALSLYLEKKTMCRRLARVKQLENKLSEFIE